MCLIGLRCHILCVCVVVINVVLEDSHRQLNCRVRFESELSISQDVKCPVLCNQLQQWEDHCVNADTCMCDVCCADCGGTIMHVVQCYTNILSDVEWMSCNSTHVVCWHDCHCSMMSNACLTVSYVSLLRYMYTTWQFKQSHVLTQVIQHDVAHAVCWCSHTTVVLCCAWLCVTLPMWDSWIAHICVDDCVHNVRGTHTHMHCLMYCTDVSEELINIAVDLAFILCGHMRVSMTMLYVVIVGQHNHNWWFITCLVTHYLCWFSVLYICSCVCHNKLCVKYVTTSYCLCGNSELWCVLLLLIGHAVRFHWQFKCVWVPMCVVCPICVWMASQTTRELLSTIAGVSCHSDVSTCPTPQMWSRVCSDNCVCDFKQRVPCVIVRWQVWCGLCKTINRCNEGKVKWTDSVQIRYWSACLMLFPHVIATQCACVHMKARYCNRESTLRHCATCGLMIRHNTH